MQIETTFFDVGTQSEMEANQKLCYCMVKALFLDSKIIAFKCVE